MHGAELKDAAVLQRLNRKLDRGNRSWTGVQRFYPEVQSSYREEDLNSPLSDVSELTTLRTTNCDNDNYLNGTQERGTLWTLFTYRYRYQHLPERR